MKKALIITLILTGIIVVGCTNNSNLKEIPVIEPEKREQPEELTISFVGDILLAENVGRKIEQTSANYPFEKVKPILTASDFAMGNLECSVAQTGAPIKEKRYTFRANPNTLEGVKWSGIDILSTANNHILDYGMDAFKETLENLKVKGLHSVGAGENINQVYSPIILEKNNKKVAFFCASHVIPYVSWYAGENQPGVAGVYNPDKLLEKIKIARQKVDIIVVYLHWGVEREVEPKGYQRNLGKLLIDNGADIVVGTHPHVLQGFEFYKNKLIAYSLGNFVFTNFNKQTLILNVKFDDEGLQTVNIIPCMIKNYRPEPIQNEYEKQNFNQMIETISFNIKVDDNKLLENLE